MEIMCEINIDLVDGISREKREVILEELRKHWKIRVKSPNPGHDEVDIESIMDMIIGYGGKNYSELRG